MASHITQSIDATLGFSWLGSGLMCTDAHLKSFIKIYTKIEKSIRSKAQLQVSQFEE